MISEGNNIQRTYWYYIITRNKKFKEDVNKDFAIIPLNGIGYHQWG